MLHITQILTAAVVERARENYAAIFGPAVDDHVSSAKSAIETALGHISTSNALYHNVEHTAHVIVVGLEILRGKHRLGQHLDGGAWLSVVVALACHDIGYVRGLCKHDGANSLATGVAGKKIRLIPGSSDATLMPVHVDRGKLFVAEHFRKSKLVDVEVVQTCIERTRFPVPGGAGYAQTGDYPGLVRAADLIGQLSDPRYLRKLPAVFFEFEEIGFNKSTGYARPGDLLGCYPRFFENSVTPYIPDAVTCLEATEAGREIITLLYANLAEAKQTQFTPRIASIG